jgi:hypothetical protein
LAAGQRDVALDMMRRSRLLLHLGLLLLLTHLKSMLASSSVVADDFVLNKQSGFASCTDGRELTATPLWRNAPWNRPRIYYLVGLT